MNHIPSVFELYAGPSAFMRFVNIPLSDVISILRKGVASGSVYEFEVLAAYPHKNRLRQLIDIRLQIPHYIAY